MRWMVYNVSYLLSSLLLITLRLFKYPLDTRAALVCLGACPVVFINHLMCLGVCPVVFINDLMCLGVCPVVFINHLMCLRACPVVFINHLSTWPVVQKESMILTKLWSALGVYNPEHNSLCPYGAYRQLPAISATTFAPVFYLTFKWFICFKIHLYQHLQRNRTSRL